MQQLHAVHLNGIRDKTVTSLVFWRELYIYKYWSDRPTPGEFLNTAFTFKRESAERNAVGI